MNRRAGGRSTEKTGGDDEGTVRDVLEKLNPGSPIRQGIERIILQKNGALIVMGGGPEVDAVCTGGFRLLDSPFSSARLAELAKMDGAIVLDEACKQILAANVHLHPDSSLATDETGSRHRTAERVARQVDKPVIAVSEERGVATVYVAGQKHQLEDPARLIAEINQSLITLERFRRRLDEAEERLTRLEISDQVTYRAVVVVLQRAELVLRIGGSIGRDARRLGGGSDLIELQLADLLSGVEQLRTLVLKDYCPAEEGEPTCTAADALASISEDDLMRPQRVAAALGFDHVDKAVQPPGYRLLSQVPRLPESVREAVVDHFHDLQAIVQASVEQLAQVEGIGQTRAAELRRFFDRLSEGYHAPLRSQVKIDGVSSNE